MSIPTHGEINVHDSLDERWACEHFLGRTLEEAEELFRENSLCYQEDLMWMGPVAFRYYVHAAINYLKSENSANDTEMLRSFAMILEFRLKYEPSEVMPLAREFASVCRWILDHLDKYGVSPENDGDIQDRYVDLQKTFEKRST